MAVRKTSARRTRSNRRKSSGKSTSRKKPNRVPFSVIFWVLLFIVLIIAFFVLLQTVRKGDFLQNRITIGQPPLQETVTPSEQDSAAVPDTQQGKTVTAPTTERTPVETPPVSPPTTPERPTEQTPPATTTPDSQPSVTPVIDKPVETRDRSIYFMQETSSSSDLQLTKVTRKLAVSDSPLLDSLNALLAGPTTDEKNRSLINFIPSGTRIVTAPMIRGNTAYINFNEEFQYNTFGREGFNAQIRQIVWTATEFSNVHDVQILIEGNRVDFLGEGIMIGSPLRR
jgi:spore germination protein GerM